MRHTISALLALALLPCAATSTVGRSPAPSDGAEDIPASVGHEEVLACVRASDPRFAGLPDFQAQADAAAAAFSLEPVLASGYLRVLDTGQSELEDFGAVTFRQRSGWLVEATLVAGCTKSRPAPAGPMLDPCAWRHTWILHVQPDGMTTQLHDTGDLEPMPEPESMPFRRGVPNDRDVCRDSSGLVGPPP